MSKLLTMALAALMSTASLGAEINAHRWENNNHDMAIVMARSGGNKFAMAEKCNGNVAITLFDFDSYNASNKGNSITYKWRVDLGQTRYGVSKIQQTEDGQFAILVEVDDAAKAELLAGDALRFVYKLKDSTNYGAMEEYTLLGITRALNKAPESCASDQSQYFSNGVYF